MNQSNLSKWLKFITIAVGIMGVLVFFLIIPRMGMDIVKANKEFSSWYWPWLIFISIMAVPCFGVLGFVWSISCEIEKDNSFSIKNAKSLSWVCRLSIFDSIFCFIVNAIFFFLGMSHPGIMILFLFVIFAGIAIAIVTAVLSHLVEKASDIKKENDLTI